MKRFTLAILILLFCLSLKAQWHIEEGFEGITTLPTGWSYFDDGDGMTWRNINTAANAHTGTRAAFVDNYLPNQNADWLITPQLTVASGDSLIFFTRAWVSTENLSIFVSTSGSQPANFTHLLSTQNNIGTSYRELRLSLAQFVGQNIRIGFYWQCTNYGILVDDVRIGQPLVVNPELNMPEEISFFQGESTSMDLSDSIVCSDPQTAYLSHNASHVTVNITGFMVEFTSPDFYGTEEIEFTLNDPGSGMSATDVVSVIVSPPPVLDLMVHTANSPRVREYQNLPFVPSVIVKNNGEAVYNDVVELSYSLRNAAGNVIATDAVFQDALIPVGETLLINFQIPVLLSETGTYSISFLVNNEDGNMTNNSLQMAFDVFYRVTVGGPDDFGYRYLDSNDPLGPEYNWIDISQTGLSTIMHSVTSWNGDDNFSEPIALGFSFPFYGNSYSSAYVDVNGEILLADNNWYTDFPSNGWGNDGNMFNYMYPIPGYVQMPALIAVYWDDLQADEGTGNVFFQSFGTSPNRYAVIQWHNVRYHAGTGGSPQLKFQVILHENGEIVMQYHTVATGQTGSVAPHNDGASATVAIQNEAGNVGLPYLREIVQNNTYIGVEPSGNLLHDNLAIRFYAGTDNQAPIITHNPIGNTFNQTISLSATIIDLSTIVSKQLHYNYGNGWQYVEPSQQVGNDYIFTLVDIPLGATVQYFFDAEDVFAHSSILPEEDYFCFKVLPTAGTEVLLAYSGSQDYQHNELPIYEAHLTESGISYDKYNWEEYPEYSFPNQYKTIFLYASTGGQGDKANTLSVSLMNFLDGGTEANPKNLWFASDGWAGSQHGHPNSSPMKQFTSGYLRTSYVASGLGGGTNGLGGPNNLNYEYGSILCVDGSPIGETGAEYSVYANSPDCLFRSNSAPEWMWDTVAYPEIGAQNIFAFEDGPFNGNAYLYHGVCGTSLELPVYKALFFSFDLSQLYNVVQRNALMYDLFDWFGILPVSSDDPVSPSITTAISNAYPNPFNPNINISYTVAKAEPLSMAIYNLKGQKIKQLVSGDMAKGSYSVSWDGTDSLLSKVGSGIYFIKLDTPSLSQTRKITLMK